MSQLPRRIPSITPAGPGPPPRHPSEGHGITAIDALRTLPTGNTSGQAGPNPGQGPGPSLRLVTRRRCCMSLRRLSAAARCRGSACTACRYSRSAVRSSAEPCRRAAATTAAAHGWLHARDRCRGCRGADPAGARRFWPAWAAALPAQPSFGLGDPTADLWINQGYVSG